MRRNGRPLHVLPGKAESGGYVFALMYGTAVVHVGRTTDARAEVGTRRNAARSFGTSLADWWVSAPHEEWGGNERALNAACRDLGGTRVGSGCWSGIDFDQLAVTAERLPTTMTELAGGGSWRPPRLGRDERTKAAVQHRADGLNARESAVLLRVSHTTVLRDLRQWDRDTVTALPLGTSPRNIAPGGDIPDDLNVPSACSSTVIEFRRPA